MTIEDSTTPSPATATATAADRAAQVRIAAAAVQDIAAVVGSPNKEAALAAAKQALTSIGTALVTFGVLAPGVWSIVAMVAGAVITASGAYWHIWDDRRAAAAVARAGEDVGLQDKLAAIESDRAAAKTGKTTGAGDVIPFLVLLILPFSALFSGCAHVSTIGLDNTPALRSRADYPAALAASPDWCADALRTIAVLEYEVAAAAPFGVVVAPEASGISNQASGDGIPLR